MHDLAEPRRTGYQFGPFSIDTRLHQLFRDGEAVPLSPKAFDLLLLLVRHRDRVVERGEILRAVWPDAVATDDSLAVCVSTLRRALGDDSAHAVYVATIPKRGYRFVAPVVEQPARAPSPAEALPTGGTPYSSPPPQTSPAWRRREIAAVAAVATIFLAVLTVGLLYLSSSRQPSHSILLFEQAPPGTQLMSSGVVSPDGRYLAFVARGEASSAVELWIRALDAFEARALAGTTGAARPFWSPDSQSIAFFAGGRLKAASIGGGPVREIASIKIEPMGASWSSNGTIIFIDRVFGLFRVPSSGGRAEALLGVGTPKRELSYRWPSFLPDGRRYLYDVVSSDPSVAGVYLGDLDSPERTRVLDGSYSAALFAAPNHLLALRDGVLVAQAVDVDTLEPQGPPRPLVSNVSPPGPFDNAVASVSTSGVLAIGSEAVPETLTWFDRTGARVDTVPVPVQLSNPTLVLRQPHQLLGITNNDAQRAGIWFFDMQRGAATRVIPDAGGAAAVSPDGDRIAFASTDSGYRDIYVRNTTARQSELLLDGHEPKRLDQWSDDGRFIVYVSSNASTQQDLWVVPVTEPRKPAPYLVTAANEMHGRISPDGRWMAYTSDETGVWEVYLDTFPVPTMKRTVSVGGGGQAQWRADGAELFYLRPDRTIMSVAVRQGKSSLELGPPRALFRAPIRGELTSGRNHYAAAPDGEKFLVRSTFEPEEPRPIRVIVNWTGLLDREE